MAPGEASYLQAPSEVSVSHLKAGTEKVFERMTGGLTVLHHLCCDGPTAETLDETFHTTPTENLRIENSVETKFSFLKSTETAVIQTHQAKGTERLCLIMKLNVKTDFSF